MSILSRIKYAMYVLIAVTMVLMLTLSIGEGIGIVHFDVQAFMSNPFYFLPVFGVGFVLAPALSERMPASGDQPISEKNEQAPYGYTARILVLVVFGLALAMLANLAVLFFGKVA